jgi:hypothetical protein
MRLRAACQDAPNEEGSMDPIERFQQYADAFEDFFEKDDTTLLEPYFTEDAVYETLADPPLGECVEGRAAVLAYLKKSVDSFDRRFESRELEILEGPEVRDGAVWLRWRGRYRVSGAPALEMEGEETVTFEGDRIRRLEDRFPPGTLVKKFRNSRTPES